jgi:hypothetical protein
LFLIVTGAKSERRGHAKTRFFLTENLFFC